MGAILDKHALINIRKVWFASARFITFASVNTCTDFHRIIPWFSSHLA